MQSEDPYADFAQRYDLCFGAFTEHDSAHTQFLETLFAKHRVGKVLDCACGTGKDLHLLSALRFDVIGSDRSAAMLRQAVANLQSTGLVPLVNADFRSLPFASGQFDAVLCLTTSLPHLLDEPEIVHALESMHRVLRQYGLLLLSQGLTDKLLSQRPRFIPEITTPDFSRIFVVDYLGTTVDIHVLDLVHEAGQQDFRTHTFEYRILRRDDYERLLTQAGFGGITYHGSYRGETYDPETSDRLIIVAHA